MQDPNTSEIKRPRLLRGLLIGSVTLNLLIVGVVGGSLYGLKQHGGPTGSERFGAPFVRALSFDDKRAVGRAVRQAFREAEVDRKADRELFDEALRQLRQTPFDPAALQVTAVAIDQASEARRGLGRAVFLARIADMDDATRRAYADRLEDILTRKGSPKPPSD